MRTRYGWLLLGLVIMAFVAGCEGRQKLATLSARKRAALEKEWKLALPSDVTILSRYEGPPYDIETGRNEHYGWVIYSPSPIDMVPDKVPSPSRYSPNFSLSLSELGVTANTVELFKHRAPRWDFGEFITDSHLDWSTDASEFHGHLLKTSNGYYLCVERFPKAENTIAATAPASSDEACFRRLMDYEEMWRKLVGNSE